MRELDGDKFARTKQWEWNKSELVEDWREKWADYQNDALEDAGFDARVDHRTLEAQGIDRDPTRHMGKEASAMERDGIATRIGDENREAARQQAELDGLKSALVEVEAEIKQQSLTRSESQEPGKKGLRYVEWYAMQPEPQEDKPPSVPTAQPSELEPPLSQEEQARQAVSAFTNEWTRAWLATPPPSPEELRVERERQWWYERLYEAVEVVQEKARDYWDRASDYWQRFVKEKEPGQELERDDPFGR